MDRKMTTSDLRIKVFGDGAGGAAGGGAGGNAGAAAAASGGGAGGNAGGPWYSALPEDIRADPSITKYGDIETFARGHLAQSKLIGKPADRLLELPGAEDEQGRLGVLRRLGAPEKVDGYKLTAPEGTAPGLAPEGDLSKAFLASAHKVGLLPGQAQAIYTDFIGSLNAAMTADEESGKLAQQEGVAGLKKEWGQAFDQNVAAARFAIEKLGGEGLKDAFERHGLENDPAFAKAFAQIGKMLGEDKSGGAGGAGGTGGFGQILAPAEAQNRGNELLRLAMQQTDSFEKKRLNAEAAKYFKMAFPDAS